ncbi:MAGUK p55 subfamily member 4 [Liparis tanakae]|uniref:MAGUK p55 subfamily member 4 n=1 Tax=Liparis tanakae TaxID=230148 RepID=A0A4Z2I9R8_9TELE|nr:MAGUK p55 subfamily member 4 [Liparis tanakae]
MLTSVVEDVSLAVSRNIFGAEVLHELLSAPWLHALLKIMATIQTVHHPSAEARELYSLLSSPHMQALLSSQDSVAQSDYGPVLPPLPDNMPEGEEAMRVVCLNREERKASVGDGVRGIRSRWSSLRRLTLDRLDPARRAWSGEELRATESEARPLPLPRGGRSRPFLPRYESTGSCCLRPQPAELWKKGLHQSAPAVFSPASCTEKPNHKEGGVASTGGISDDYAYPPPPVSFYSLSFPNSPNFYKKGATGGQSRNIPTPGRSPSCTGMSPLRAHTAPSSPAAHRSTRRQGVSTLPTPARQHVRQLGSHNKLQEEPLTRPSVTRYSTASHHNGRQKPPQRTGNEQEQPKRRQPQELPKQCSVEELRSTVQTVATSIERGPQDVRHLGQKMVAATEMITGSVEENAQALNLLAEVVDKLQGLIVAGKHAEASAPRRPRRHTPPPPPPRVSSMSPKEVRKPPTPYPRRLSSSSYSSSSSSCTSSSSSTFVSACADGFMTSRCPKRPNGRSRRTVVSFGVPHGAGGGGGNGQARLHNGAALEEQRDCQSTGGVTTKKKKKKKKK